MNQWDLIEHFSPTLVIPLSSRTFPPRPNAIQTYYATVSIIATEINHYRVVVLTFLESYSWHGLLWRI